MGPSVTCSLDMAIIQPHPEYLVIVFCSISLKMEDIFFSSNQSSVYKISDWVAEWFQD